VYSVQCTDWYIPGTAHMHIHMYADMQYKDSSVSAYCVLCTLSTPTVLPMMDGSSLLSHFW